MSKKIEKAPEYEYITIKVLKGSYAESIFSLLGKIDIEHIPNEYSKMVDDIYFDMARAISKLWELHKSLNEKDSD